jgi:hypothetical protein
MMQFPILVLLFAFVLGAGACELNPASFPAFGERCESNGDCEGDGYVCFRKEADDVRGICVDESTLEGEGGEGEGENAGEGEGENAGEGEGEGEGCNPPCANNQVCVNNTCRVRCDVDTPCAGNLACCGGGCTLIANCDDCQTPNGACDAGQSCVITDFLSFDGLCVDQAPLADRVDDLSACDADVFVQGGNECDPGSSCVTYVNGQSVCQQMCTNNNQCGAGRVCETQEDAIGVCAPSCEPLAPTCSGELAHCTVRADCSGRCTITGPRSGGEACNAQDRCQQGFECIDNLCVAYCDPLGANTCGGASACLPLCDGSTVGVCQPTCTTVTATECGGDSPNCQRLFGCAAFCTGVGVLGVGAQCNFVEDCAQGLTCTSFSAPTGQFVCREICDPQAPVCVNGGTCTPFGDCAEEGVCVP